ncbi:MAG: alpha/beta hydrolase [Acidobacteriia bacterium]|nr:alpha/beta hydrolase [Terriglobia bacterium]
MSKITGTTLLSALTAILISLLCGSAAAQQHITGTLADGATYVIDVPANWNHKLLLYSHGFVAPGSANPAYDYGDPYTGYYVFTAGYALAGSSYATTGWAIHEALPDQIAVLDVFQSLFGTPTQTIAWGHSMGGIISAALVQQYPNRFNGALPMCGVVAGSVGLWNEALDAAFAFNTLLAGGSFQVVHLTDPVNGFNTAEAILGAAQSSARGRARIALVAALADVPGWIDPSSPEPSPTDYTTQEVNQFAWLAYVDFAFQFYYRAELEARAGGNPSFNTGVNYAQQLKRSRDYAEVQALYAAAGLTLDVDLATLKKASRIAADPSALTYLSDNIIFTGQLSVPVLTLHTTADGLVPAEDEKAYSVVVHKAGDNALLRETFIHRAGHCEFTPAEQIAAFQTLDLRLRSGKWQSLAASQLNAEATALGPVYNFLDINGTFVPTAAQFLTYQPLRFLRVYDAFTH